MKNNDWRQQWECIDIAIVHNIKVEGKKEGNGKNTSRDEKWMYKNRIQRAFLMHNQTSPLFWLFEKKIYKHLYTCKL